MQKTLIIAEKPSVARDIARVLNCTNKSNGYIENDKYIITWAIGHLITLKEPDEIDEKYKRWILDDLPILPLEIPLKIIRNTSSQYTIVKKLMNSEIISDLICATDAGREGELIFRLIYKHSKCEKPFRRLWISSLTDSSIKDGFKNLKSGKNYNNLYYSAVCRSYADWYIGMNASRIYSIKYNTNISIGRVQTPTLSIIVSRQLDIDNFIASDYYTLIVDFGTYKGTWFDPENSSSKTSKQIKFKEYAEKVQEIIKNKEGRVTSNITERNIEPPPLLYDLTSLQRDANIQLSYTAKKTLSIAQDLYEKYKLITYPRTDSRYLSDDIYPKVSAIFKVLPDEYSDFISKSIKGLDPKNKRIFNNEKVSDHHAIIPTGKKINLSSLPLECTNILKLIIQRFLSVFYPPCLSDIQKIITLVENHNFISQGKNIVDLGWREVDKPLKEKKKLSSDESIIPNLKIGDINTVKSSKINQEKTKPPERYTDASLLSAMENAGKLLEDETLKTVMKKNGIGTPATRAAIIERLIEMNYIIRTKKYLIPTEKGKSLIEVVPENLSSPELTGNWELELNSIADNKADGQNQASKFLSNIRNLASLIISQSSNINKNIKFPSENKQYKKSKSSLNINCPLCGKAYVLENTKAFYCSDWKNGCKFTLWKNNLVSQNGPILDKKLVSLLLKNKKVEGSTGTIVLDNCVAKFYSK